MPLDFGQAARISVEFPEATGGIAERFGRFPPVAHLAVYNPLGAQVGYPPGAAFLEPPDGSRLLTATPAVSREPSDVRSHRFNGGGDFSAAGDYYVGVSVQQEDYTVELPFTIRVEVVGEPAQGPTYAGGATWTVADGTTEGEATETPDPSDSETPDDGDAAPAAASADDDSDGSATMLGVGAGVLGVAALVAALVVWRRRQA